MSVIEVEGLWKSYRIYRQRSHSLKETILARRSSYDEFWALRDVNFSVEKSEMLGVIGANGSGKSTLLKCLARILTPNAGRVRVDGKVSALLELGTGFHPELSGRENVYLAGSILGLSRQEITRRFDEIVAFAGVGDFLDTPIKNYSSGMQARLAFSVSISVDPEILLIDEVLAVGDIAFQMRCYERIHDLRRQGKTVVFVSHSLPAVRELCSRVMWLFKGDVRALGDTQSVVQEYTEAMSRQEAGGDAGIAGGDRWGSGEVLINDVEVLDLEGGKAPVIATGAGVRIRLHYEAREPIDEVVFGLSIQRGDAPHDVFSGFNTLVQQRSFDLEAGRGVVDYVVASLPLWQGTYALTVAAHDLSARHMYDRRERQFGFLVVPGRLGGGEGYTYVPGEWEHKREHAD